MCGRKRGMSNGICIGQNLCNPQPGWEKKCYIHTTSINPENTWKNVMEKRGSKGNKHKILHNCVRPYKTIHNQTRPFETLQGKTLT